MSSLPLPIFLVKASLPRNMELYVALFHFSQLTISDNVRNGLLNPKIPQWTFGAIIPLDPFKAANANERTESLSFEVNGVSVAARSRWPRLASAHSALGSSSFSSNSVLLFHRFVPIPTFCFHPNLLEPQEGAQLNPRGTHEVVLHEAVVVEHLEHVEKVQLE